jgi:hypothetical protein
MGPVTGFGLENAVVLDFITPWRTLSLTHTLRYRAWPGPRTGLAAGRTLFCCLLASILFTASFDVLDRIADEDQRKKLARRVHPGAYV